MSYNKGEINQELTSNESNKKSNKNVLLTLIKINQNKTNNNPEIEKISEKILSGVKTCI